MKWAEWFEDIGDTLRWKVSPSNNVPVGTEVRGVGSHGYYSVRRFNKAYLVHRVLWEMRHGPIPDGCEVDHIDGNRLNNTAGNLRLASRAQQTFNTKMRADNTSGHRGVYHNAAKRRWDGMVQANGRVYRKSFSTKEDAINWTTAMRKSLHKEFAR